MLLLFGMFLVKIYSQMKISNAFCRVITFIDILGNCESTFKQITNPSLQILFKSWVKQIIPSPTFTCYVIKTNSMAFSPQANPTDWATATCWRNLMPTFADRGVSRGQRGGSLTVVNLSFARPEPLLFFHLAPNLSSQGLSGPRSRPTATQTIWQRGESNPGPLNLQPGSLTTRPQRWSRAT
jgi:hypothetical protein